VADQREPHRLTEYLKELSGMFHKYYHDFNILNKRTKDTTLARIYLIMAIKNVLNIAFDLIGVGAPEKMQKKNEKNTCRL